MSNQYEIIKLDNEVYDFLIIATSNYNPIENIDKIKKDLSLTNNSLIFDLAFINGVSSNRYIKCDIKENMILPVCSVEKDVGERIKSICRKFYSMNDDIIKKSIIPNPLKFLLKSGMV